MNIYKINQIYKIAFNLLEKANLNYIPVDTLALAKKLNVCLFTYSSLTKDSLDFMLEGESEKEAFSYYESDSKIFYLFYDDELTETKRRFVIARELVKYVFKDFKKEELEVIKEIFPVVLLVPTYSLFFLPDINYKVIVENYDVSKEVALKAISYFKKRIKKYGNKMFKYEEESFEIFKLN